VRSLLTYAPLPEWQQVFNSLINLNNNSNNIISKPYVLSNEKYTYFSRSVKRFFAIKEVRKPILTSEQLFKEII